MNKISSYGSAFIFQFGFLDLDTPLLFEKLIKSFKTDIRKYWLPYQGKCFLNCHELFKMSQVKIS